MHYLATYFILYFVVRTEQFRLKSREALYDGAQVWRSNIQALSDVTIIKQLMDSQDISVWHLSPDEAIFLVQPERKLKVHRLLNSRGLNHTVIIMDVQRRIEEQQIASPAWGHQALRRGHRMEWGKYPTIEVVNEYLKYLVKQYPSICTLKEIGRSVQNRTIKMITVSNGNPRNKALLVVSGQHAREWMAIASALFILREIVTKFDNQPDYIQNKNWYIIPLSNPDGYHYTYTHDRLWRKNRRRLHKCHGVDLNRNFGKNFNIPGITVDQECKESYSGPRPFSEPESVALRKTALELKNHLSAMVDLHTFGQLILFPWSAVSEATPDAKLHNTTTAGMFKAILEFKNRHYSYGPTYHLIYPATGSLIDWAYSIGIRHSYVIEGRDRGAHGFLIPPEFIQEIGQEMLIAVRQLASVIEAREKVARKKPRHRQVKWF